MFGGYEFAGIALILRHPETKGLIILAGKDIYEAEWATRVDVSESRFWGGRKKSYVEGIDYELSVRFRSGIIQTVEETILPSPLIAAPGIYLPGMSYRALLPPPKDSGND